MAWYDPLLILMFVIGILFVVFSHGQDHHHKRNVTFGLILIFSSLIIKTFIWFESLL